MLHSFAAAALSAHWRSFHRHQPLIFFRHVWARHIVGATLFVPREGAPTKSL